jgi:hypothetical protein
VVVGAIELASIRQRADVLDDYFLAGFGAGAFADDQVHVLQPGGKGHHLFCFTSCFFRHGGWSGGGSGRGGCHAGGWRAWRRRGRFCRLLLAAAAGEKAAKPWLDAIKEAGIEDNTLVIFTSDNGPEITGEVRPGVYDRLRQYGHASMGKLRGAKRDLWEGGHRVPYIARWPGHFPAGATSSETICHVDLLATVAALLGEKLADNAGEDSFNILPALLGEKLAQPLRSATVHHAASGKFAIRRGDWVFIDAPTGDDNGPLRGEPQWLKDQRGYQPHNLPGELYNLADDLAERNNLYAQQPDKVRELATLLKKYQDEGRSR